MFSRCLPFNLSEFAIIPSTEPNSFNSFDADFGPIPGIPGILSAASPCSPRTSITCSTLSTSKRSQISFGPHISAGLPPLPGRNIFDLSVTNCPKSLSGVIINVLKPSFSAIFAKVPIVSSASKPATSIIGILNAAIISLIGCTIEIIPSGVSSRCALYSGNSSFLPVEPPGGSKTTAMCVGFSFFKISINELVKPNAADVFCP